MSWKPESDIAWEKKEFKEFLWRKMKNHKFKITKEAGVFICKRPRLGSNYNNV